MPRQNGVILARLDALNHLFEQWADVRLLRALLLLDHLDVLNGNAEAFCGVETIRQLVGNAPLLPLVGSRALAGIQHEPQGLDIDLLRLVWPVERHEGVVEVF